MIRVVVVSSLHLQSHGVLCFAAPTSAGTTVPTLSFGPDRRSNPQESKPSTNSNTTTGEASPLTAEARGLVWWFGRGQAVEMAAIVTVNDVLDGRVMLDLECLNRIYVNGYLPNLQVGGQVMSFLTQHLGNPIPSPAILEKIGTGFRRAVRRFARRLRDPGCALRQERSQDRGDARYLAAQAPTGRPGLAATGVAQEFARCSLATKHTGQSRGCGSRLPRPSGE